jgi:hypothetical protein
MTRRVEGATIDALRLLSRRKTCGSSGSTRKQAGKTSLKTVVDRRVAQTSCFDVCNTLVKAIDLVIGRSGDRVNGLRFVICDL